MLSANASSVKKWYKIALSAALLIFLGFWLAPYFSGAKSLSPYLLEGALVIRWYGATMALGLLAAIWAVLHRRAITPQFSENQILGVIIWAIIGGFIGARLLFVVLKWPLCSP